MSIALLKTAAVISVTAAASLFSVNTYAQSAGCELRGQVFSSNGAPVNITLSNLGHRQVHVYSIDGSDESFQFSLDPGELRDVSTFEGNHFSIFNDNVTECVALITANSQQTDVRIDESSQHSGSSTGNQATAGAATGSASSTQSQISASTRGTPDGSLTAEENQLAQLINDYRISRGLPAIPISRKLTKVAQIHARDTVNFPAQQGNLHSWSSNGNWTPVIYTPDHANAAGMWSKPREIAGYNDDGYEISSSNHGGPQGHLTGWQGSSGHNDVLLEQNSWAGQNWQALGVGMYQNVAHVWFGRLRD